MATVLTIPEAPSRRAHGAVPQADDPDTWPVIWRVVAPGRGSYDHDMVYVEVPDEPTARASFDALRADGHPVRLERVQCGPLPEGATALLRRLRATNAQNPGTRLQPVIGGMGGAAVSALGIRPEAVALDVRDALVDELGLLRLILRTLEDVDLTIGEPATADACEDVAVATAQLGHLMERLERVKDRLGAVDADAVQS